ncbi:MAG: uroporphyrinogen decarboxylase [Armatimonadota bacterium]|nr:uroporphyrinogen decarboxylase [bacterium]MDW8321964.1 uroporphyrinogen decarboxylase [Armatimonadota bacterium]
MSKHFNDRFLRACRRERVDATPIWLMRQAGRYLPEYRELRQKHSMLELCTNPELAVRVTLMPLKRFDLDAAILFSDLTIPFLAMGVLFTLKENLGPVITHPLRTAEDIYALRVMEPNNDLPFVAESIRMLRQELKVPLIGFAGAPFTLAAYLVEGGPSRDYSHVRALMYSQPELWNSLLSVLAENVVCFLKAQIEAGAQAVQLFDSWVGVVSPVVYRRHILPVMQRIVSELKPLGAPIIYFGTGTASLLEAMRETGADVIGVDWRVPLDEAWRRIGDCAIQGNLDPAVMMASSDTVCAEARDVLRRAGGRAGHIFNLGHGVLPGTPVENVQVLIDTVHLDGKARVEPSG